MPVEVLPGFTTDGQPDLAVATRAARAWLAGGIVGLPTETVYGLAADAQDESAVARVYRVKGRPADHPLIVHVAGPGALDPWSDGHNEAAARLSGAFWPGPLTVVVARSARAADFITGGQATVALRCPDHPVARACLAALARESGDPARGVAAPSANRFGRVSPTRAADVIAEVGERLDAGVDLVVDGGPCAVGVESTIVDCTAVPPRVLRAGAVSQAQVDAVLAGASAASQVPAAGSVPSAASGVGRGASQGRPAGEDRAVGEDRAEVRAPGTLESHYAPLAQVVLVDPAEAGPAPTWPTGVFGPASGPAMPRAADPAHWPPHEGVGLIAAARVATPVGWVRLAAPGDTAGYAHDLYAALRRADELGLALVVAVLPDPAAGPLALAVRDRLARAAHQG